MKRWFDTLRIHRKLVVMALLVTAAALVVATSGLILLDVVRFRTTATEDIQSLAAVIAENSAAAAMFEDLEQATENVRTARVRPTVTRMCLYLLNRSLLDGYSRAAGRPCPPWMPADSGGELAYVDGSARVTWRGEHVGFVYAERDLSDLGPRITMTALGGVVMLLLAALLAYAIAQRLQRTVSRPIVQLAAAARTIGEAQRFWVPGIEAAPDEVGELVHAFTGMVDRVRVTNEALQRSNDTLTQEIEERRRIEAEREALLLREREANRLKDEFLAAVSHELRTPLNAILGWVQILASTSPSAQTTSKAITSIVRNAHAQTRVIEDLIDVSRITTGKLTLRVGPLDLRRAVEGAVDVLRTAAQARRIELSVQVPDTPSTVDGDPDRLQQVVWNLLSNAVKFTPPDGRISVILDASPGAYEIRVSDTGIGMTPDFLEHAFDRFRQADGSLTREYGGLGLGLAIVKELTELHGGTVSAASPGPGKGATFTVRLPRSSSTDVRGGEAVAPEVAPPRASLAGLRVLAVDDNLDALEIVSETLTAEGAIVQLATRGADAIREWERAPVDVLICDLAMPDMTGFEVVQEIRAREATLGRRTPAVALSAHASEANVERCRRAGFDRHLAKPFDTGTLARIVAELVSR